MGRYFNGCSHYLQFIKNRQEQPLSANHFVKLGWLLLGRFMTVEAKNEQGENTHR